MAEVERWLKTGRSCYQKLLLKLKLSVAARPVLGLAVWLWEHTPSLDPFPTNHPKTLLSEGKNIIIKPLDPFPA